MKFFEVKNPYYALISAETEHDAWIEYNNTVCEIEENDEAFDIIEVEKSAAIEKYNHCVEEDMYDDIVPQPFENISSFQSILIVDGSLL
jgi:hypothetical protein